MTSVLFRTVKIGGNEVLMYAGNIRFMIIYIYIAYCSANRYFL